MAFRFSDFPNKTNAVKNQWPFQDPRLEVPIPYIRPNYIRPKFQGISPENMALYGDVSQSCQPSRCTVAPLRPDSKQRLAQHDGLQGDARSDDAIAFSASEGRW